MVDIFQLRQSLFKLQPSGYLWPSSLCTVSPLDPHFSYSNILVLYEVLLPKKLSLVVSTYKGEESLLNNLQSMDNDDSYTKVIQSAFIMHYNVREIKGNDELLDAYCQNILEMILTGDRQ